jgi:hypothetical protein
MKLIATVLAFAAIGFSTFHFRDTMAASLEPLLAPILAKIPSIGKWNPADRIPSRDEEAVEVVAQEGARTWTFSDGSSMDAILLSADSTKAQFRVPASQGVGQVSIELLSPKDRKRIQQWIGTDGKDGVAGYPVPLKTHRWPDQWRVNLDKIPLTRVGETREWRSPHFDITNRAGIRKEALESITLICEAVDGALNALPLPLPVNWGRDLSQRRKIIIERGKDNPLLGISAGYWDGRTGIVHINADALLEPDLQLVVFEFNKPEKVQKYDVIVHEVTHQSTAALMYLGVPAWVSEGIAEYMAATQFAPAYYEFENTHVSVRHHVNKRLLGDRIVKDRRMNVARLEKLMNRDIIEWNSYAANRDVMSFLQYNESLILMDYFLHRDHPDGVHFRRYLECVLSGVPEPEARELHLLRGRSYTAIEEDLHDLWKPLGFTFQFRERSDLLAGDVEIDWEAEDVKRTIATQRATGGSFRGD